MKRGWGFAAMSNTLGKAECLPSPSRKRSPPPTKQKNNNKSHTRAGAEELRRPWSGGEVFEEEEKEKEKEEGRVESLCSLAG